MKILDVLHKSAIISDLNSIEKTGIIKELVIPIASIAGINPEECVRILMEREQLGSTGIGDGIGIPHGKMKSLDSLVLGFGRSRKGVDFESIDGLPTYIFFMLITPENSTGLHLKLLARISRILKSENFKKKLLKAADQDELFKIIKDEDEDF